MCDACWKTFPSNPQKIQSPDEKHPRIVIDVTGGIVQGVWADIPVDVRIIDGDENPPDTKRVINIAEDHAPPEFVYVWESIPHGIENKEMVDRIFERTAELF
jgi:hypothetical protein